MIGSRSIRARLLGIIALTTFVALMVAGAAILAFENREFKRQRLDAITAQADMLGAISSAALNFDDAAAAQEYLTALSAKPDVVLAAIYDAGGRVFATYTRAGMAPLTPPVLEPAGHRYAGESVLLYRPIRAGNDTLGTIFLRSDLGLSARLWRQSGIILLILVGALLLALLLSAQLQKRISRPILAIADVARTVIERRDYSPRVRKSTNDEVGMLVDAFNQMLGHIQQREAALQNESAEHKAAREEIAALNESLERRVAERTAALEFSNKELETFAYAVSHDLRAPLRSIDGFSMLLARGLGDQIDDQGKHYLQRVRDGAQRMGHLIDDLLKLARTARSGLHCSPIKLSEMAQDIVRELQQTAAQRQVNIEIEPDLTVHADPHLLRTVMENLLGNAWKFTGKRDAARIEVGSLSTSEGTAYFVRDNGAGFDMKYAEKLFRAFQRLHPTEEYEGTGVGLANVQRVIQRHGGRVWAESKIDHGATFYFTLPSAGNDASEQATGALL